MTFVILSLAALFVLQPATSFAMSSYENGSGKPVMSAYYTGWHADSFPLSAVSWNKYNTLIYAFAVTTPSVHSLSLDGSNPSAFPEFVSEAHKHGVAAHVSLAGWTGSKWFSTDVATPENRTAFVKTVVDFAEKYKVDGLNFDWEYPNYQGIGCNIVNPNDSKNFLSFLQELRANPVGAKLTLTAATSITPFPSASGIPTRNVSGFAEVLDYVSIMDYDVSGSWSPVVRANAPLNDTCAPPAHQAGSAVSAVKAWTTAGMPLNKIVLGVAAYGHSFSVRPSDAFVKGSKTLLAAYPKFNASNQPLGDAWSGGAGVDACGVYQGPGGTFTFWGLIAGGFLTSKGSLAPGIYYRYDNCSQTPYVYNKTSEVMVSFDNAASFIDKGKYIKETGLKGFAMWEAGGDYHDILLDAIRRGAGYD